MPEYSFLDACDATLPLNPIVTTLRFSQLFPIEKSTSTRRRGGYLALHPLNALLGLTAAEKDALAADLASQFLVPDLGGGRKNVPMPDPGQDIRLNEKIHAMVSQGFVGAQAANVLKKEIGHAMYKSFTDGMVRDQIRKKAYFLGMPEADFRDKAKLKTAISASSFLESEFMPTRKYQVGILAGYEQTWALRGYSRGELVKGIGLWPGETVTLEYHYWDKSISKSEQELTTELELKRSSTVTQRETKEVVDEMAKNNQLELNSLLGQDFKMKDSPLSFNGQIDGGITAQLNSTLGSTVSSLNEAVENVSNDFKQNRRVKMEETRDTGREEKQTRVVTNTNRCHTLEIKYFEILANYRVKTKLAKITPCLLLPYSVKCDNRVFSKGNIDYKFILCNESLLKGALLDKLYLPGFEGAKKIATYHKLIEHLETLPSSGAGGAGGATSVATAGLEEKLKQYRESIIDDYDSVRKSADPILEFGEKIVEAAEDLGKAIEKLIGDPLNKKKQEKVKEKQDDVIDIAAKFFDKLMSSETPLRKLFYFMGLSLNGDAIAALKNLKASASKNISAIEGFEQFVRSGVTENDFQFVNPLSGQIADFFESFGLSDDAADLLAYIFEMLTIGIALEVVLATVGAIIGGIVGSFAGPAGSVAGVAAGVAIGVGIGVVLAVAGTATFGVSAAGLEAMKDDAGLHVDVQAALSLFKDTRQTSTGSIIPALPASQAAAAVAPRFSIRDFMSLPDLAEAEVEFERLICHIECNFEHYKQALWLGKGAGEVNRFLKRQKLNGVVSNTVMGFYDGLVAFPLISLDVLKHIFDTKVVADFFVNSISKGKEGVIDISVPTGSTVIRGKLGDCDLCEPYIQHSRAADVRQQLAKAALTEAEARQRGAEADFAAQETLRAQARLNSNPADLSDPISRGTGKIEVSVTNGSNNP